MSTASTAELAQGLMLDGIAGVQEGLSHPFLRNTHVPLDAKREGHLKDGLRSLNDMEEVLSVNGLIRIGAYGIYASEPYPRIPIVENTLTSVAVSPELNQDERRIMVHSWVAAASTGRGRVYPTRLLARHGATQVLEYAYQEMRMISRIPEDQTVDVYSLISEIDDTFLTTRALKGLSRAASSLAHR